MLVQRVFSDTISRAKSGSRGVLVRFVEHVLFRSAMVLIFPNWDPCLGRVPLASPMALLSLQKPGYPRCRRHRYKSCIFSPNIASLSVESIVHTQPRILIGNVQKLSYASSVNHEANSEFGLRPLAAPIITKSPAEGSAVDNSHGLNIRILPLGGA